MVTPGEADAACAGSGKRLVTTFQFYMKRAIGGSTITAPDGKLINPATLVSNRVVAKNAELELLIGDFVWQPPGNRPKPPVKIVDISFKLNGHDLPDHWFSSPTPNPGVIRKLKFPVEFLRFPQRSLSLPLPAERLNTIEVYWSPSDFISPLGHKICGDEARDIDLTLRRVRFDAMAPIILIHGNNECPDFFKASGNCSSGKPKMRFNFEGALQAARVPYDLSIKMIADSVENHAAWLDKEDHTASLLRVVRSFGAKHFHIIAHSKGGLDSRALIARLPRRDSPYAPISLTTLDTSHLGSPAADYMKAVQDQVRVTADPTAWMRLKLAWKIWELDPYKEFQWRANDDLTTERGKRFHKNNVLPTSMTIDGIEHEVHYSAIGADANTNNSSTILGPTIYPPEDEGLPIEGWQRYLIPTMLYRTIGETARVEVKDAWTFFEPNVFVKYKVAVAESTNQFELNDVVVPLSSQQPGGARFVSSGFYYRNHASVADPIVGQRCVELIVKAQPLRSPK